MLCMIFLHQILGWRYVLPLMDLLCGIRLTRDTAAYSAWVGFATMIVSLPVPGLITKYIRNTQREKMKRVCHMFTFDLSMADAFVKDRCSCAACH